MLRDDNDIPRCVRKCKKFFYSYEYTNGSYIYGQSVGGQFEIPLHVFYGKSHDKCLCTQSDVPLYLLVAPTTKQLDVEFLD